MTAPLHVADVVLDGARTAIRCADGLIAAIGPDVGPEPGDERLDGGGMSAVPGLVNAHTHAAMTLFRGFGDDLPLMEWLQTRIWPAEAHLTPDDVYWGTRLALVEMVRSGTTSLFDMYWHGPEVARACADAGVRATVSTVFFDNLDPDDGRAKRATLLDELDAVAAAGPLVRPSLGPHAVYTVSGPSLAWLAELSAARDLPLHIHLSETRGEVERCLDANGERPPAWLDRLGALSPRTIAAHGCWLDPAELELLAERGATVATCPVSNMKLATGRTFPYEAAATVGVPVGLGSDGASSNNSLDLLQDLKVLALLHKHTTEDPAVLPASEAVAIATGQRSAILGGQALQVGAPADLILVRTDDPELVPSDGDAAVVYSATGAQVDTTVVAGRVLMRARHVDGVDEVIGEARARAARLRAGR